MSFVDKINLIIALIGCITGSVAFALSLYLTLLEVPLIRINILSKQVFTLNPFVSTTFDEIGNDLTSYSKEHCLIGIHLIITNVSKNPTSIYEINLNNKYFINASNKHQLTNFPTGFYLKDGHLFCNKHFSYNVNSLKPVVRLEGNETLDCCLTFVDVPLELQNAKKLKLTVKTSQEAKTISFKPNFIKFTVED